MNTCIKKQPSSPNFSSTNSSHAQAATPTTARAASLGVGVARIWRVREIRGPAHPYSSSSKKEDLLVCARMCQQVRQSCPASLLSSSPFNLMRQQMWNC